MAASCRLRSIMGPAGVGEGPVVGVLVGRAGTVGLGEGVAVAVDLPGGGF